MPSDHRDNMAFLYGRISDAVLDVMKKEKEKKKFKQLDMIYLLTMMRRYLLVTTEDKYKAPTWFIPSIFELRQSRVSPLPWKPLQDTEVHTNYRVISGSGSIVAINLQKEQADALIHIASLSARD